MLAQDDTPYEAIEGIGTRFELPYVTISTDAMVYIKLRASSEMIDYFIESASEVTSAILTLENLEPYATYYMYEDSCVNEVLLSADANGTYTYLQDLARLRHVFIQRHSSTVYISEDTKLQSDIYGTVEIVANNVVLDGNGHRIIGPGGWTFGIYAYGVDGVTIENCVVEGHLIGIFCFFSVNCIIRNNIITSNSWAGIELDMSSNNVIDSNTVTLNPYRGILLAFSGSVYNEITKNSISSNAYGVYAHTWVKNNVIHHNNFIGNTHQAYTCDYNEWDDGYPSGGNYWSDYNGVDDYSGPHQNEPGSDGLGDTPYQIEWALFPSYDHYPLMLMDAEVSIQTEILTIKSWDLSSGVEQSLVGKLEDALELLNKGNINGATHKLLDLVKKVINDAYHLTQAQKDYIIQTTQEIIGAL